MNEPNGAMMNERTAPAEWQRRLRHVILQERLVETGPSLTGLEGLDDRPPGAIYMGVGLCTDAEISVSLPVDLLGMLLPAELVRRAVGAGALVVLVADEHALGSGFHRERVSQRADETERLLRLLADRLGLDRLRVERASRVHRTARYRRVLAEVGLRAPPGTEPYFRLQVADIEHMRRELGGVIKVGWVVSGSPRLARRRDELAFDERYRRWVGGDAGFVYCRAGRTLDDRRPKASPYVVVDPSRRICLLPDEDVSGKLARAARAASPATVAGARRHLKAVSRLHSKLVGALDGPVERRVQTIVSSVFGGTAIERERWRSSYASISGR